MSCDLQDNVSVSFSTFPPSTIFFSPHFPRGKLLKNTINRSFNFSYLNLFFCQCLPSAIVIDAIYNCNKEKMAKKWLNICVSQTLEKVLVKTSYAEFNPRIFSHVFLSFFFFFFINLISCLSHDERRMGNFCKRIYLTRFNRPSTSSFLLNSCRLIFFSSLPRRQWL